MAVFWLMAAAVLAVSLYVLYIKVKSFRQVQPTVNLPSQSANPIQTISGDINGVEEDIVLEDVGQPNHDENEEVNADDDGDDQLEDIEEVPDLQRRTNMVQRQNPDPFMFYRIKSLKDSKPHKIEKMTSNCLPNKWSFVDNTRRAMSFNLVSLCLLVMLMPTKLQQLYFYFSESQCDGHSAVKMYKLISVTELVFAVMYPFIIKSKLHHQN